jgi:hypothetical protein
MRRAAWWSASTGTNPSSSGGMNSRPRPGNLCAPQRQGGSRVSAAGSSPTACAAAGTTPKARSKPSQAVAPSTTSTGAGQEQQLVRQAPAQHRAVGEHQKPEHRAARRLAGRRTGGCALAPARARAAPRPRRAPTRPPAPRPRWQATNRRAPAVPPCVRAAPPAPARAAPTARPTADRRRLRAAAWRVPGRTPAGPQREQRDREGRGGEAEQPGTTERRCPARVPPGNEGMGGCRHHRERQEHRPQQHEGLGEGQRHEHLALRRRSW